MLGLSKQKNNIQIFYALYYILLLLVLTSWKSQTSAPSVILRVTFLVAVIVPLFVKYKNWLPAVITCFIAVTEYGFSYSYMPTMYYYYVIIAIISLIFNDRNMLNLPRTLRCLLVFVFFVDLLTSFAIENIEQSMIIICCFLLISKKSGNVVDSSKAAIGFATVSLILSLFFFTTKNKFMQAYGDYGSSLERIVWTDPNYFGMMLGMGIVTSLIELLRGRKNRVLNILFIAVILLSLPVQILNASRGAILATFAACLLLFLFSNQKKLNKVIIAISMVTFLIYMFNNNYFELLLYRVEHDAGGGGSGRFDIWAKKIDVFLNDSNILQYLFGWGNYNAYHIGASTGLSFHNDYVAFFVSYGLIGFIIFLSVLLSPFFSVKTSLRNKYFVAAVTLYLLTIGLTLEPLCQGRLPFWCFVYYLILLSKEKNQEIYENCHS